MNGPFEELRRLIPDVRDPWTSMSAPIPFVMFGRGSRKPFSWYLEGETRVEVTSVDDIEHWLLGCEYVDDFTLFGKADHWMHPGEFELIRMGDCDDHALWAWRKMVDLGLEASLVAGRWREQAEDSHVWVVLRRAGRDYLFESTSKVRGEALRPLDERRNDYSPFFAVDERLKTRAYAGAARELLPWSAPWRAP